MLDDAARSKASVLGRVPPEKLVAIALVALLHLVLVWLLLKASLIEIAPRLIFHEAPITLWLQTAPEHENARAQAGRKAQDGEAGARARETRHRPADPGTQRGAAIFGI